MVYVHCTEKHLWKTLTNNETAGNNCCFLKFKIIKVWKITNNDKGTQSKKAQIIMLIARFLLAIQETKLIPFVNSNIPVRIGTIKSVFILNKLKQGTSKLFNIFII